MQSDGIHSWLHEATILRARSEAAEAALVAAMNMLNAHEDSAPVARSYMFSLSEHHTRASQLAAQLVACKRCPQRWLQTVKEEVLGHCQHGEQQLALIGDTHREAVLLIALTENMMAEEAASQMDVYQKMTEKETKMEPTSSSKARASSSSTPRSARAQSLPSATSRAKEVPDKIVSKPAVPRQRRPLSSLQSPADPSSDAVAAFASFMVKFGNKTSLGWSDEDHAVFIRCVLNGNNTNKRLFDHSASISASGVLGDITAANNQRLNTQQHSGGGGGGNPLASSKLNGAIPLSSGVLLRCQRDGNYCCDVVDPPDQRSELACLQQAEGMSAIEACLAKLPHMTLADISEHMTNYETYVHLLQRKHEAIEAYKAQRAADKVEAATIEVFRSEQDALHGQLAEAAKERARLLRHQHNKRLVEGWKANKAASIQHTALKVLQSEAVQTYSEKIRPAFAGANSSINLHLHTEALHHSNCLPHELFSESTATGDQMPTPIFSQDAPTFTSSHPTLDEMTMDSLREKFRNANNEATLQQLLHECRDAERRQAATKRIQQRQAEIKEDVQAYKAAKEMAMRKKAQEEEEFLRSKGYPVPPRGYRASSSFASSSSPTPLTHRGRVGGAQPVGHFDPYNLHTAEISDRVDQNDISLWQNVPQRRAHSSGSAFSKARPPSADEAPASMKRSWARDEEMIKRRQELAALKEAKLNARANVPAARPTLTKPIVRDVNRLIKGTQATQSRAEAVNAQRERIGRDDSRLKSFTATGTHSHLGVVGWAGGLSR